MGVHIVSVESRFCREGWRGFTQHQCPGRFEVMTFLNWYKELMQLDECCVGHVIWLIHSVRSCHGMGRPGGSTLRVVRPSQNNI